MRRLATAAVLVGIATVVLVQFDWPASIALWALVVIAAVVAVGWRRWPARPGPSPSLLPSPSHARRRQALPLAAMELEVAAAVDPRLGGERPLRRRLVRLTEERAGMAAGSLDMASGVALLGGEAAAALLESSATMTAEELEQILERIERL
ncbi:MAG TPA: hypothetical protein VLB85_10280 [Acidimicrobiia bacterium]|nr:hypothetical protein [Acidimicrobiia bacterium]